MTCASSAEPLTVAIVDDHDLVVCGVAAMLAPHADRVALVEIDPDGSNQATIDIVLFDTVTCGASESPALEDLVANPLVGEVILYTWELTDEIIASARARGVHGALSKSLDASSLVTALRGTHNGGVPTMPFIARVPDATDSRVGHDEGLTCRESEIVALIAAGLSNRDIASLTYLSMNSVKSYIRSAYRTMDVSSRSRAVLWGIDHGLAPTRARVTPLPSIRRHSRDGELGSTGTDQLGSRS